MRIPHQHEITQEGDMTKKHFKALATELKYRKPCRIVQPRGYDTRLDTWRSAVDGVANVCASFNGRFDRGRFLTACGVEN
jgi:hypothetical protein